MIVYTFHHDSVCSGQRLLAGSLNTTLLSHSISSSCPSSTLLLTLVSTLFIVLFSTLRQHLHKLFHSALSILYLLLHFLPDICEEEVTTTGAEKLDGGCDSDKTISFLSQICTHANKLYYPPLYIPFHMHSYHPSLPIRIAHFLCPSLALLSAHLRLII